MTERYNVAYVGIDRTGSDKLRRSTSEKIATALGIYPQT
ncbi:hypothetical protein [Cupriavidus sp. DL-D2]